jgi:hypothetical protein
MKQSPSWEANSCPASQYISRILWNLKIHYCIHISLPLVPILRQINPFLSHTSHFFKIHFNSILPSMPRSAKWYLSFLQVFLPQCRMHLFCIPYMLFLAHSQIFKLYCISKDLANFYILSLFWKNLSRLVIVCECLYTCNNHNNIWTPLPIFMKVCMYCQATRGHLIGILHKSLPLVISTLQPLKLLR